MLAHGPVCKPFAHERWPICIECWLAGWRIRTKRWPTKVLVCKPSQLALQAATISYHPQSGWFEDTPLKGGTEEGCPLKGVHEGPCLLRLGSVRGTTIELLSSHRSIVCPLSVARRIALGAVMWCGKRDSPTRRPLLPLTAGTAEPFRVSPPEAVAYHLELDKEDNYPGLPGH